MNQKKVKDNLRIIANEFPSSSEEKSVASRRTFIKTGLIVASGAMGASASLSCMNGVGKETEELDQSKCIDYGRSFFCNTAEFNSVRMWIESRTTIIDTKSGKSTIYYQEHPVKREHLW